MQSSWRFRTITLSRLSQSVLNEIASGAPGFNVELQMEASTYDATWLPRPLLPYDQHQCLDLNCGLKAADLGKVATQSAIE